MLTRQQPLFPDNRVNYVLRTYLPPWKFEERLADIICFCEETDTRHVLLFSDAQFLVWNNLTIPEAEEFASRMRVARDRLAEHGIRVGLNTSYNMRMSRWDHRGRIDLDHWATCTDGDCDYRTPCLLDPKLEVYLRKFYTVMASIEPDYIFIDDDHRYMLNGTKGTWGCFCDLHLRTFSELTRTRWTRDTLARALVEDVSVRTQWIELLGERLVALGEIMSDSIHAVNPEIEVGMMVPCVHLLPSIGHNIKNVLDSFKPIDKPLVRPCIGGYNDWRRRDLASGLFYLEFIRHYLGPDMAYTPEIESCPFTRYSKGMTVTRYHIIQGLLNGMGTPLLTVSGYNGDSPYFEPAYPVMLNKNRNYFEELLRSAPKAEDRKGVQFVWSFDSEKQAPPKGESAFDYAWPSFSCHEMMSNMGFPTTYAESPVKFLAGDSVRALPEAQVKKMLSENLILDVGAIRALIDLGYAEAIGCKKVEALAMYGSEKCVSPEFCGEHVDTFITLSQVGDGTTWKLIPQDKAKVISEILDHDFASLAPGMTLFENSLGGKVCLLPFSIRLAETNPAHLICYQRRTMLRKIIDWMKPDLFPLFVDNPVDIMTQAWRDDTGTFICLTNLSYDLQTEISVISDSDQTVLSEYLYLNDDGNWAELSGKASKTDGERQWRIEHDFLPFSPLVIKSQ